MVQLKFSFSCRIYCWTAKEKGKIGHLFFTYEFVSYINLHYKHCYKNVFALFSYQE